MFVTVVSTARRILDFLRQIKVSYHKGLCDPLAKISMSVLRYVGNLTTKKAIW